MTQTPSSDPHSSGPVLTVVMPVFNEEEVLSLTARRLRATLDRMSITYEVLVVDDGSRDGTRTVLSQLRTDWPELRIVTLRRNSGHQAAITAGIELAAGAWVVTIDADLQDPPELIATMFERAHAEMSDVVYAVRGDRSTDTPLKRWTANAYYRVMRSAAGPDLGANAGDFRLMSRAVVNDLRGLRERHRVYRLLVPWLGYPSSTVTYRREVRAAGVSKYPLHKMVRLGLDSVTSFSAAPLRLATWLGLYGAVLCSLLIVGAVVAQLAGSTVPGWASVAVAVLFVGAVQLISVGLLGEYIGRLYAEAQHRPLYFVGSDTAADQTSRGTTSCDEALRLA